MDEHIRLEFLMLVCRDPNKDLLNLFPGLPGDLRLQLMHHPWMVKAENGVLSETEMDGDGVSEEGEHVDVKDDAGDEEGGGQGCWMMQKKKGQE